MRPIGMRIAWLPVVREPLDCQIGPFSWAAESLVRRATGDRLPPERYNGSGGQCPWQASACGQ